MQTIPKSQARRHWLRAQGLDRTAPFGTSVQAAVEHLGYVQIDTIHVIERCHHHILHTRMPEYRREDLHRAQAREKTVFEYWTHALSYVPTRDVRFYLPDMKRVRESPGPYLRKVTPAETRKVMRLIREQGPLSIRDIEDDTLVEKDHEWASRKPSKRALQLGFYSGRLAISARVGMLKKYELMDRHFGWDRRPTMPREREVLEYLLDRALRAQSIVSLDSICYLSPRRKPSVRALIEERVRRRELVPVVIEGASKIEHWIRPEDLESPAKPEGERIHILSPFDPLVIQRKRLQLFFEYEHRFEAYVPPSKRVYGYFALPVLVDDRIAAAIDLKTDRDRGRLLVQKWTWIGKNRSADTRRAIERELDRFERFQLS